MARPSRFPRTHRGPRGTGFDPAHREVSDRRSAPYDRATQGRIPPGAPPAPAPGEGVRQTREEVEREIPSRRIRHNARTTDFTFQTTTESQTVLSDNPDRAYLAIQNRGANAVFIGFGSAAGTNGFRLVAGGFYEPYIPPRTSVHIRGAAADDTVVIIEGMYGEP